MTAILKHLFRWSHYTSTCYMGHSKDIVGPAFICRIRDAHWWIDHNHCGDNPPPPTDDEWMSAIR